jgi:hypothetical protein
MPRLPLPRATGRTTGAAAFFSTFVSTYEVFGGKPATLATDMTSIGVVIPTRDRAQLLRRAVGSVGSAEQVIVIDDASTTYAKPFIEELESVGVEYVRLDRPQGPCAARNVGIDRLTADLAFFLDDDDYALEGGLERIRVVADEHPGHTLYLHNCRFPDGGASLDPRGDAEQITFEDWVRVLAESARTEFKPAVRKAGFEEDRFDDTGAGGEGLLWARLIRRHGAVLSREPVVFYDAHTDRPRLTSSAELLARAPANARVARAWLGEIGPTMRSINPPAWERLVLSATLYSELAGDGASPRVDRGSVSARTAFLLGLMRHLPRPVLAGGFRLLKSRNG